VDQGDPGDHAAQAAEAHQMSLEAVKLPEVHKGMVLPKRWIGERSTAWVAHFRRLARADEQVAETLAGWHCAALAIVMLHRLIALMV
jgi:hypothetical protein